MLTNEGFKNYILALVEVYDEQKEELSELDRKLGDGDHGVTMNIGYQAVKKTIEEELKDQHDIAKISVAVGKSFLDAVGSSVGPLYASGYIKGALVTKGLEELSDEKLYEYWISFSKGIKSRGKAEIGDKTMIDTLEPFFIKLEKEYETGTPFKDGYILALNEARNGMESTEDIVSNKGRSKRLGYRSKGFKDPGAVSSYLMLEKFQEFI
ncbi:dihydroxyacetone kinase subunit L [Staphylococcus simulans]|uniref:dihydroxyacetone kinase subunit DhaL n=1 Tax=Staphylococcus simulans TaxID=1286 RepID=UPI001E2F1E1A|nr:dihydroxyacetone kinase subunit DhaL [Staphylococcus simulans]MCD8915359.1 dihydroxyacetone kinase subunit L [Staphylococcus simulans]